MFKALLYFTLIITPIFKAFPQSSVRFVDAKSRIAVPFVVGKCGAFSFITDSLGTYRVKSLPSDCKTFTISALGYISQSLDSPFPEVVLMTPNVIIQDSITIYKNRSNTDLVKVITVTDDKKEKYSDVSEVIKYSSALNIKDYGGIAGLKTASMRGIGSENLLVLFNEVLINDIQSGSADLGKIPFFMIDKVELGENGFSSSGISAGGVLGMSTLPENSLNKLSLLTKVSDIGHREVSVSYNKVLNDVNLKLGIQRSYSTNEFNYNFESAELSRKNAFYSRTFIGAQIATVKSNYFLKGYFHYSAGVQGIPGFVVSNNTNSATSSQTTRQILGIINGLYNHSENIASYLTISYQNQNLKISDPDHTIFRDRAEANGFYYSLQGSYRLALNFEKVEIGLFNRFIYNDLHDESEYYATSITEYGLYRYENKTGVTVLRNYDIKWGIIEDLVLKGEYNFTYSTEKITVKNNTTYNKYNSFALGFELNFLPDKTLLLHGNLFSSSRLPNFSERFYSNIFGYGELRNEDYYGYEVGCTYKTEFIIPAKFGITFFNINGADKIIWQPVRFAIQVPKNVSKVKSSGFEISSELMPVDDLFNIQLSYIYDDVRNVSNNTFVGDESEDKFLIYQPLHQLSSEITLNYKGFNLGLGTQYSSRRYFTSDNDISNSLPSFFVADLFASYRFILFSAQHTAGIKIYNLFNNNYSIIQSYPMPNTYITLNYGVTI